MKRTGRRPAPAESSVTLPRHPIAVVATRTGLSQDVLRVWERRYEAVRPTRSPGGQRLYADADIERLRLLRAATGAGRSIAQIAGLPTKAIAKLVDEDVSASPVLPQPANDDARSARAVDDALTHVRSLDGARLDAGLRRVAAQMGTIGFLDDVAVQLLRRVGDEWHAGLLTPAHEHLASSVVHDCVVEMMRALPQDSAAPRVLVATPAGERHVIGAAMVGASAAAEGWNVLYLGADLPAIEIAAAAVASGVRVVALSIVYVDNRVRTINEVRTLRERLPERIALMVGGAAASSLRRDFDRIDVRVVADLSALTNELRATAS